MHRHVLPAAGGASGACGSGGPAPRRPRPALPSTRAPGCRPRSPSPGRRELRQPLRSMPPLNARLLPGVAESLVAYAKQHGADLVVVGSRGLGAVKSTLMSLVGLGSVSGARCACELHFTSQQLWTCPAGRAASGSQHGDASWPRMIGVVCHPLQATCCTTCTARWPSAAGARRTRRPRRAGAELRGAGAGAAAWFRAAAGGGLAILRVRAPLPAATPHLRRHHHPRAGHPQGGGGAGRLGDLPQGAGGGALLSGRGLGGALWGGGTEGRGSAGLQGGSSSSPARHHLPPTVSTSPPAVGRGARAGPARRAAPGVRGAAHPLPGAPALHHAVHGQVLLGSGARMGATRGRWWPQPAQPCIIGLIRRACVLCQLTPVCSTFPAPQVSAQTITRPSRLLGGGSAPRCGRQRR